MNPFKKFYAYLHLRWAVRLADKAYKERPQRYYVLRGENGNLIVSDRRNFRGLRQKRWIKDRDHNVNLKELAGKSFYYTPYTNGDGVMPRSEYLAKMVIYFGWWEESRMQWKQTKRAKKAAAKAKKAKERQRKREARRQ